MLLVGVPAWKHAHAGGDPPHLHEHEHEGESRSHLHVTLFGLDFSLPAEPEDQDDEQGRPTYLVAATPTIELGHAPAQFIALTQPIPIGEPLPIVPPFRGLTGCGAPLSSTAHLEQSRVLLI